MQTTFEDNVTDFGRVLDVMAAIGYDGWVEFEYVHDSRHGCSSCDNVQETMRFRELRCASTSPPGRPLTAPDPAPPAPAVDGPKTRRIVRFSAHRQRAFADHYARRCVDMQDCSGYDCGNNFPGSLGESAGE